VTPTTVPVEDPEPTNTAAERPRSVPYDQQSAAVEPDPEPPASARISAIEPLVTPAADPSLGEALIVAQPRVRVSSVNESVNPAPGPLDYLTGWLKPTAIGIRDVMAVPVKALELLLRALFSAGAGLIVPVSLLIAFAVGAFQDRRIRSNSLVS
jgi:hypothetical protein